MIYITDEIPIQTPTNIQTPSYSFKVSEDCKIRSTLAPYNVGGSLYDTTINKGDVTLTFDTLTENIYNETITLIDIGPLNNSPVTINIPEFKIDLTPPVVQEISPGILTGQKDSTPEYKFTSNKSGILRALFKAHPNDVDNVKVASLYDDGTWGPGFQDICIIKNGINIITFETLSAGLYENLELEIIDDAGNKLSPNLVMSNFTINQPNLFIYIPHDKRIDVISNTNRQPIFTFISNRIATFEIIHDNNLILEYSQPDNNNVAIGENTIKFGKYHSSIYQDLDNGTYSGFKLKVTDNIDQQILIIPDFTIDIQQPQLNVVTPVPPISNNINPSFTFYSNENGTIAQSDLNFIGQDLVDTNKNIVIMGKNTLVFNNLVPNSYTGKIITVKDIIGNQSTLTIPDFIIDTTLPNLTNIHNWETSTEKDENNNDVTVYLRTDFDLNNQRTFNIITTSNDKQFNTSDVITGNTSGASANIISITNNEFLIDNYSLGPITNDNDGNFIENEIITADNSFAEGIYLSSKKIYVIGLSRNSNGIFSYNYTINSSKTGTLTSSINFTSSNSIYIGVNTVTFNLNITNYLNHFLKITDEAGNENLLTIENFIVEDTTPIDTNDTLTLVKYKENNRIIVNDDTDNNIVYISHTTLLPEYDWNDTNVNTLISLRNSFIKDLIDTNSSKQIIVAKNSIPIEKNKLNKDNYDLIRPENHNTISYIMTDAAYKNRGLFIYLENSLQTAIVKFNNIDISFQQDGDNYTITYNYNDSIYILNKVSGEQGSIIIDNNTLKYTLGSIILESDESLACIIKTEVDGYAADSTPDTYTSGSIYHKNGFDKSVNLNLLTQINNNLNVFGNVNILENITICKDVDVHGNMKLKSSLNLQGNLNIGANLNVQSNISTNEHLIVNGDLWLSRTSKIRIGDDIQPASVKSVSKYNTFQYYFSNIKKDKTNSELGNRILGMHDQNENIFSKWINIYNERITQNTQFKQIEAYIDNHNTDKERKYGCIIHYYDINNNIKNKYPTTGNIELIFNKKGSGLRLQFNLNPDGSIQTINLISGGNNYLNGDLLLIKEDLDNGINQDIKLHLTDYYLQNGSIINTGNSLHTALVGNYNNLQILHNITYGDAEFKIEVNILSKQISSIQVINKGTNTYNVNDTIIINKTHFNGTQNDLIIKLDNDDIDFTVINGVVQSYGNLIEGSYLQDNMQEPIPINISTYTVELDVILETNINHLKSSHSSSLINGTAGLNIRENYFIQIELWSLDNDSSGRDIVLNLIGENSNLYSITSGDIDTLLTTTTINSEKNISTSQNLNVSGNINVAELLHLGNINDLNNNIIAQKGALRYNDALNRFQGSIKRNNELKWVNLETLELDTYSGLLNYTYTTSLFHLTNVKKNYKFSNRIIGLENTNRIVKYEKINQDVYIDKYELNIDNLYDIENAQVSIKILFNDIEQPLNSIVFNDSSLSLIYNNIQKITISYNTNPLKPFEENYIIQGTNGGQAIVLKLISASILLIKPLNSTQFNQNEIITTTDDSNVVVGQGQVLLVQMFEPSNIYLHGIYTTQSLCNYFNSKLSLDYFNLRYLTNEYKFKISNNFNVDFTIIPENAIIINPTITITIATGIASIQLLPYTINKFNISTNNNIFIYGCENNTAFNGLHTITLTGNIITFDMSANLTNPTGNIYIYKYDDSFNNNLNHNTDNLLSSITTNFTDANSAILTDIKLYKSNILTDAEISITLSGNKLLPIDDFLIGNVLNTTLDVLVPNIIKNTTDAIDTIGYQNLPNLVVTVIGSGNLPNNAFNFKIENGQITGIAVANNGTNLNYNDIIIVSNIPSSKNEELHISLEKYLPNNIITQNCSSALYQRITINPETNNLGKNALLTLTFEKGILNHIAVLNPGYGYSDNDILTVNKNNIVQTLFQEQNTNTPLIYVTNDINITLNNSVLDTQLGSIITSITATKLGSNFKFNDILTIKSTDVPGTTTDAIIQLKYHNISTSVLNLLGLNHSSIIRNNNSSYESFVPTTILSKNLNSLLTSITQNITTGPDVNNLQVNTITNNSGNEATLSITILNNIITNINVINHGYNYQPGDEITIPISEIPTIDKDIIITLTNDNVLNYHSNIFTDSILEKKVIIHKNNDYNPVIGNIYDNDNRLFASANTNLSIMIKSDTNNGSEVLLKLLGNREDKIILSANDGVDFQFANLTIKENLNLKYHGNINVTGGININEKSLFKQNLIVGPKNLDPTYNGFMGIGTDNPLAPLHVEGHNNDSDITQHQVSIYASNVIYTGSYYASDSDRRIKTDIKKSNINNDYEIFNKIDVLDYNYIDTTKSNKQQKGFIAQQIKYYYPQAVDQDTGYLPNIMQHSLIEADEYGLFIILENIDSDLLNQFLKLIIDDNILIIQIYNIINNKYYFTPNDEKISHYNNVFVYGQQVDDLLSLDYNKIHCLHFNSTKKLINIVNQLQKDINLIKQLLKL